MLTAAKNLLRPILMEGSYKPALIEAGFNPVKGYPVSSMVVYRCNGASQTIIKMARKQNPVFLQDLRDERKVLERMYGCQRIPKYISYQDHLTGSTISALTNFLRTGRFEKDIYEALQRTYIPGRELNPGERISSAEEQSKLVEVVRTFHSEGIANFSVQNRNLVVDEDSKTHFIDFGGMIFKDEVYQAVFQNTKSRDLEKMDTLFD